MEQLTELECALEAVLFAAGEPVPDQKLCAVLSVDRQTLTAAAKRLADEYDFSRRGIRLLALENAYQLCSRADYAEQVRAVLETRRAPILSASALEVLAIIAYKQPVTKIEIEKIRGVNSDRSVNKLVELELVKEVGRLDAPGRPMLFGTTEEFLRTFGVGSIDELPVISEDMVEQYKEEAEYEIASELKEEAMNEEQLTLDI